MSKIKKRVLSRIQPSGKLHLGNYFAMMSRMINLPWISRTLCVVSSNDPTLIGVSGTVLDETKKTVLVRTESGDLTLAKEVITFTIDSGEAIEGSRVTQRAEDRIGRRY